MLEMEYSHQEYTEAALFIMKFKQSLKSIVVYTFRIFIKVKVKSKETMGDVPGAWLASAPLWPSLWT